VVPAVAIGRDEVIEATLIGTASFAVTIRMTGAGLLVGVRRVVHLPKLWNESGKHVVPVFFGLMTFETLFRCIGHQWLFGISTNPELKAPAAG
jgi:hypothetical protein